MAHSSLSCLIHQELVLDFTLPLANGAASQFPSSEKCLQRNRHCFLEPTKFEGYNFLKKYVNSKKGGKSEENIPEDSMTGKM